MTCIMDVDASMSINLYRMDNLKMASSLALDNQQTYILMMKRTKTYKNL